MKNRNLSTVKTADNSYTLFYKELNEHYHSLDGAQSESEYVYIKNGLERIHFNSDYLNVLEIGFGSGMNAVLTYEWAVKNNTKIIYYALEPFPIESDIIDFLLHNTELFKRNSVLFKKIHKSRDSLRFVFDELFEFHFWKLRVEDLDDQIQEKSINVVFFDAFAPSRQEEIWSIQNLKTCFDLLKSGGIISTYCASGQFKRNLISAGFDLIKEKGFGKKREMFLGKK